MDGFHHFLGQSSGPEIPILLILELNHIFEGLKVLENAWNYAYLSEVVKKIICDMGLRLWCSKLA